MVWFGGWDRISKILLKKLIEFCVFESSLFTMGFATLDLKHTLKMALWNWEVSIYNLFTQVGFLCLTIYSFSLWISLNRDTCCPVKLFSSLINFKSLVFYVRVEIFASVFFVWMGFIAVFFPTAFHLNLFCISQLAHLVTLQPSETDPLVFMWVTTLRGQRKK